MTADGGGRITDTLATYQDVTSIHVYSLAPNPQRDLLLLSDLSRALAEYTAKEQDTKKYGTIANPYVRRRERHARPVAAAPAKPQPAKPVKTEAPPAIKSETSSTKPEPPKKTNPFAAAAANKAKQEAGATDSAKSSKESTPAPSASKPAPAPASKKGGIMQSFAKAASKPPKPKAEVKKEEDTAMALSDDGEADDDDQDIISSKKKAADSENDTGRKSRKQREEELRRMMEEEDEEENDEEEKEEVDPADQEMAEAPEPEPEPEPETKEKQAEEPQEVSKTENGRRRGKRRVMKKKRTIDEKGYMGKSCLTLDHPLSPIRHRRSNQAQSPPKRPHGSHFPKTRHRRLPRRRLRHHRPPPSNRRRPLPRRARATLCPSSPRSNSIEA